MITKHHDAIEKHMDHGLPGRLSRTQAAVAFAPEWPVDSDIRPGPTMPEHWRSSNYVPGPAVAAATGPCPQPGLRLVAS